MHFDISTRQRWMRVLAHSQPAALSARMSALNLAPDYDTLRAPEIGLVQIQARMGGTGERFFAGDATLTRAAIRLNSGTLPHFQTLMETLIAPLEADRAARIAARQAEVNTSRVDFFTLVRGDNA